MLYEVITNSPIRGLYALCDNSLCPDRSLQWLAEKLLLGGAPVLQLRVKGTDAESLKKRREAARHIISLKKRFHFTFIINDEP